MCLQPRQIVNRTKCLRPTDASVISVPCGECEECRYIRRTEYAFRIYAEMQKNVARGWKNYFFTLTYNDDNLPKVSFCFKGYHYNDCPVFRRSDIIRFFKNIREYVLRTYGIKAISWICCPEYGSHTQRPHYHCYLSLPLDPDVVHMLLVRFWRNSKGRVTDDNGEDIEHFWNFRRLGKNNDLGFVYPKDPNGGVDSKGYYHKPLLISSDGIQASSHYVAKYCTKDLCFYGLPYVKAFLQYCKSADLKELKKLKNEHIFSVLTSNHFGESINDHVKSLKDLVNGVSTSFRLGKLTQIPQYNKRKLLNITRTVASDPSIKIVDVGYTHIHKEWQRSKYRYVEKTIVKDSHVDRFDIREKGDPLPNKPIKVTDIYKPNYKYKVRYDLTQLGKDVAPTYFDNMVTSLSDRLRLFLTEHVFTRDFEIFYNSDKRPNLLSHFLRLVDFRYIPHIKDIALYSSAYRGRVSPLHLQSYCDDSDIFSRNNYCGVVTYHNENGSVVTPDGISSYFVSFAPSARLLYPIRYTSCKSYRFLGSEKIETMSRRAKSFFLSSLCFDKYVDEDKINPNEISYIDYVHFNSFPCFKGFDELLDLMQQFYCSHKAVDCEIIAQYQNQVAHYKQQLSENDYELNI